MSVDVFAVLSAAVVLLMAMSDIFQIFCPSCNSKLNAKAALIGQTRPCPKCRTPVLLQCPAGTDSAAEAPDSPPLTGAPENLRPQQLENSSRYFILGADRLIAVWEISKGWQVNVGSGFASARSNLAAIPDQGTFAFAEMTMAAGIPHKLSIFKISSRGALTVLFRDAHAILGKLEEPVDLSAPQKDILLRHLRQTFMSGVLDNAAAVIACLTSQDT